MSPPAIQSDLVTNHCASVHIMASKVLLHDLMDTGD